MHMPTDAELLDAIKSSSLALKTKTSYRKQLAGAMRLFYPLCPQKHGDSKLGCILLNPQITGLVPHTVPTNTVRSYVAALLGVLKRGMELGLFRGIDALGGAHIQWGAYLKKLQDRVREHIESNRLSEREKQGWVPLTEWRAAWNALRHAAPAAEGTILVGLHALVAPLRGGDYARLRIVRPASVSERSAGESAEDKITDKDNVLEWAGADHPARILVREHKTARTHGTLERTLPMELKEAIAQSLAERPRDYLFVDRTGAPYKTDSFLSWKGGIFRRVFGKPATTNTARHAFVSQLDQNALSKREARDIAHSLGHDLGTQRDYVRFAR